MAGLADHAPSLDADGRENAPRPRTDAEPLVAGDALSHRARTRYVANPVSEPELRGRVRLPRAPVDGPHGRRQHALATAGVTVGRAVLRGVPGHAALAGHRAEDRAGS